MRTTLLSSIIVPPDRQRRDFDESDHQKLISSISEVGLLHPLILREDGVTLVAGERRLRALRDMHELGMAVRHDGDILAAEHVPFVLLSDLDPTSAELAEYEENICRKDLSWQERASATARIRTLRATIAASRGLPPPTTEDIAEAVGRGTSTGTITRVNKEIILSRHLHLPEVAGAKTADEAYKALRRSEDAARATTLGESVGRTFTHSIHRAFNEGALSWAERCPAGYFDCILTDPPFGMGSHLFGDGAGTIEPKHTYADDDEAFEGVLDALAHSIRITKPAAHLYVFCDIDRFFQLRAGLAAVGWQVHRTPLIWQNESKQRIPWPGYGPQRKYELILYACKAKRPWLRHGGDVLRFDADENLGHAAQKPVALYTELLRRSCQPGDTALDLYCGSGPVFPAAHSLKVAGTGVDQDPFAYGLSVKRIEELK